MAKNNTNGRTLEHLRNQGYIVGVVERWLKFGNMAHGVRQDLWNVADIIAVHPHLRGATLVQSSAKSGMSARFKKVKDSLEAKVWLETGNSFMMIGWAKHGRTWLPVVKFLELRGDEIFYVEN